MAILDFLKGDKETLHEAVSRGDVEAVKRQLKHQKNIDEKNQEGLTALQIACRMSCPSLMIMPYKELTGQIKEGAITNKIKNMHIIIELLLKKGGNPNIPYPADRSGYSSTPLLTVLTDSSETAILLIDAGADVNVEDAYGWNPLARARRKGDEALVKILLQYGAQENKKSLEMQQKIIEHDRYLSALDPGGDLRISRKEIEGKEGYDSIYATLKPFHMLIGNGHDIRKLNWTQGQLAVYLASMVEEEVNNGGFDQYFFNGSGNFAVLSVKALKRIGAHKKSELLHKAISVFPENNCPTDHKQRWALMETLPESAKEAWNQYDHMYYEIDETEQIYDLCVTYINQHQQEFIKD